MSVPGLVLWSVLVTSVHSDIQLTDNEYFSMPKLYELDNFEECMSLRRGVFCVGNFELLPHRNDKLMALIEHHSSSPYNFNQSKISRGYCLPTTCGHIEAANISQRFEMCVNNLTRSGYGLESNLVELNYCRTASTKHTRTVDQWDLAFACVVGVILALNLLGTLYDVMKKQDAKGFQPLLAWSLFGSWQRLTADHSAGDQRLTTLKPIHGMKMLTLLLVMLAHSVYAFSGTYLYNPRFFELASHKMMSAYLQNGTMIVQTFILISSFLLAYNLLLSAADNPKKSFGMKMLPRCLIYRVVRISPLYLFTLGLATSWWAHASDGPLWGPLIDQDVAGCRAQWWTHVIYLSNILNVEEKCLVHTWFLPVDMQVYVVCACLVLSLLKRPRAAVHILLVLLLASMALNLFIIYYWQLEPMLKLMVPEKMRSHFVGDPSFQWLYKGPWNSLPTAIIGLIAAFVHHNQQTDDCKPSDNKRTLLYRAAVPGMLLWVAGGHLVGPATDPLWVALYAAGERPVFAALTAVAMIGFFNKIDNVCWRVLSWRGWEVSSRMSLSVYLVHWLLSLLLVAVKINTAPVSVLDIGQHWLGTIFLSLCAGFVLHLFVEVPAMKFLHSLLHISN